VYVKTKQRGGRTQYFLCIGERGGNAASSAKSMEYSVCLGDRLELSAGEWREILGKSQCFRTIPLQDVLAAVEKYAATRGLSPEIVKGLRQAAQGAKQSARAEASERRSQEDERTRALRVLGLRPGASDSDIESAFRRAARRHHPDVGGDSAKFRAIADARNLLLGGEASRDKPER
jgi:hypothetical protein